MYKSSNCPHPPLLATLLLLCMAELPSPIWKINLEWLNYHIYIKKQRGILYGGGTITYKTTGPIYFRFIYLYFQKSDNSQCLGNKVFICGGTKTDLNCSILGKTFS
jgi:hypothetical protein